MGLVVGRNNYLVCFLKDSLLQRSVTEGGTLEREGEERREGTGSCAGGVHFAGIRVSQLVGRWTVGTGHHPHQSLRRGHNWQGISAHEV